MMDYSSLLKNNRIKVGRFSQKQIHGCLDLAARDVKTARKIVMEDPDWGYTIAYNAMLQAARALMFSEGYRATGEAQHATVIQFAQISLGGEFNSTVQLMDVMRRKRHRAVYDIAGLVSSKEANEAIQTAASFVAEISKLLTRRPGCREQQKPPAPDPSD